MFFHQIKQYVKVPAFTLSEVLLVLSVIGVVAALTVPTLVQKVSDVQYKVAWKQAFSDFSQATSRLIQDNGGSLKNTFTNSDNLRDRYLPYLQYVKTCPEGATNGGNCFVSGIKYFDGTSCVDWGGSGMILNNGSWVKFELWDTPCLRTSGTLTACGIIDIDINGPKPPNTWGKDIFRAWVQEDSLKPMGSQGDSTSHNCITNGFGCPALYLYQ